MSIEDPRVSVVVPTFNRERVLGRALDSVLSQTVGNLEIVVVDDASSDGTPELVKGYSSDRLRCLRHDENRGGSAARNTGIEASRAPLLAFLDDDDEWLPEKLERQLEAMESAGPEVGVVFCGFEKVSARSGEVLETSRPITTSLRPVDFLRSTRFATSVALIRRECLERVGGFDEELAGTQDRDLWLRIAESYRFVGIDEVLARHLIHEEQITAHLGTKIAAKERMLAKYREQLARHPEILAYDLWRLGLLYCAEGQPGEARPHLWRATRLAFGATPALRDLVLTLVVPRSTCSRIARGRFKHLDGVPQYY